MTKHGADRKRSPGRASRNQPPYLARRASDQARRFGVKILVPQQITQLRTEGSYKHLKLGGGLGGLTLKSFLAGEKLFRGNSSFVSVYLKT